jgi:NAD(P)H-flavin reductase
MQGMISIEFDVGLIMKPATWRHCGCVGGGVGVAPITQLCKNKRTRE